MPKKTKAKETVKDQWQAKVKKILKLEMLKRDIGYVELSELLKCEGVEETPGNLKTKINRGTFSATFFLQVLDVMGCTIVIEDHNDDH